MIATTESIRSIAQLQSPYQVQEEVKRYLNTEFNDLDSLLLPSTGAGPSRKKRKTLDQEIEYYEKLESDAAKELAVTSVELPKLLEETQGEIQNLLTSTQGLTTRRFGLVDRLSRLIVDLNTEDEDRGTVLEQLEGLQGELGRLEVSYGWIEVFERVVLLSEEILDKRNHTPSPLSVLGRYKDLSEIVSNLKRDFPAGMMLLSVIDGVREKTWAGLKDVMSKNLMQAAEALKWPTRIIYPNIPAAQRRAFERSYQDLLFLQAEGERLNPKVTQDWTKGDGLYPIQALVKGIELRFKYHFQGSRNTNRVDKPEWAFANISDQIYEHQSFIKEYLQPLTTRAGYDVDVKSEFTLLLFPILLQFLRSRIPHLLDHPALLAHTIYQTILFDESVKTGGFDLVETSIGQDIPDLQEWEGLAGVILKQEGWFEQWVNGERKFGENQTNEIISSADAWNISEDLEEEVIGGLKATVSSRQIKALIEQITDRYYPLPQITHKLPFLTSIQLPLLQTYHSRITSSLDAFETLSSAFVRAVPGALTHMRGGIHVDQRSLTGGVEGLGRLVKAYLSSQWMMGAVREWADDPFFIEMSDQLVNTPSVRYKLQSDPLLSNPTPNPSEDESWSVWDLMIENYRMLSERGEEMIVRLITAEVEGDLKKHLQRRWDQQITPSPDDPSNTYPSLISALVTLSTSLSHLTSAIPQTSLLRIYRSLTDNLVTHISHRGVYSGWSKFTSIGGSSFTSEIQEFIHTSQSSLPEFPGEVIRRPWRGLVDIGRVLELPNEGEITFQEGMAAAWGGDGAVRDFGQRLGVGFGSGELQGLLRRRVECWR